jgi:soluble lytic murein transglycosylase-like protein
VTGIPCTRRYLAAAIFMVTLAMPISGALEAGEFKSFRQLIADAHAFNRLVGQINSASSSPAIGVPAAQIGPVPYYAEIQNASQLHRIPAPFIAAVIRCESNWDPGAESSKGARGLMQIMPRTAEAVYSVRPALLWDPRTNISVGTAYLRRLADRYRGNPYQVVAAYNAGPTRIDKRLPLPRETRRYGKCVRGWYPRYARALGQ